MEIILHIIGLCPEHLSHFSIIDFIVQLPSSLLMDILNYFKLKK